MPWRGPFISILVLALLAGCSGFNPAVTTPTVPATPTLPPDTATPTPRPTRTSTSTPTVTPTFTPTATPTPLLLAGAGTPLPADLDPLTPLNAPAVSGLASWTLPAVTDLTWTPAGESLVVAGPETVAFFDPLSREVRTTLSAGEGLSNLAFSPDGAWLASAHRLYSASWGSEYGTIQLWRGPAWEPRGTLYIDSRGVTRIAFNPNGQNFAAAFSSLEIEQDSSVEIFNTTTWEITRTLQLGTSLNIEFSPDGTLLASVPERYATKMWQMNGGRLAYSLRTAFTDAVNSLAFSSDGSLLATGHYDGTIRVWNARSGALIQTMQSEGVVESLAFSPLNNLLAAGGSFRNSEVRLWDLEVSTPVRILPGHTHGVDRLSFSPDGRLLASASYDGEVRLWGVRPGAVLTLPSATPTLLPVQTTAVGTLPAIPTGFTPSIGTPTFTLPAVGTPAVTPTLTPLGAGPPVASPTSTPATPIVGELTVTPVPTQPYPTP